MCQHTKTNDSEVEINFLIDMFSDILEYAYLVRQIRNKKIVPRL